MKAFKGYSLPSNLTGPKNAVELLPITPSGQGKTQHVSYPRNLLVSAEHREHAVRFSVFLLEYAAVLVFNAYLHRNTIDNMNATKDQVVPGWFNRLRTHVPIKLCLGMLQTHFRLPYLSHRRYQMATTRYSSSTPQHGAQRPPDRLLPPT